MSVKILLTMALLIAAHVLCAQNIRGRVTDKQSGTPLVGAYIIISSGPNSAACISDSAGFFLFSNMPPGRYQAKVTYLGFSLWKAEELLLQTGKEIVLGIALDPQQIALAEVEVNPNTDLSSTSALGTHGFSIEQTQRFAAAFYDPARLATSFAGVVNTDDQANNLVIRGNSPAGLQWRLQGVNVVNPNHLANAGTFTDRAAPTGGGVNILSAQLLDYSRLHTGNFQPGYGNSTAGFMDMQLRNGNSQKREHTLQASLLGIDVATEGPLSKEKGSAYLVNYRYSTVGLLSGLGVNFGNEQIDYQDLSANISLPTQSRGNFTVFAVGGTSRNNFTSPDNPAEWETDRDRYHVKYNSGMFAVGATHHAHLAGKKSWQSAVAFSGLKNDRSDRRNHKLVGLFPQVSSDHEREHLVSWRSGLNIPVSDRLQFEAGLITDHRRTMRQRTAGLTGLQETAITHTVWQPYANTTWQPHRKLRLQAGLQHMYSTLLLEHHLQPQTSARYQLGGAHFLSLSAGRYGQLPQTTFLHFQNYLSGLMPQELRIQQSDQVSFGYAGNMFTNWRIKSEIYYQQLSRVAIGTNSGRNFSAINYLNETIPDFLKNTGSGRNYGVETSVEKPLANGYYFLLSGTVFRSLYTGADNRERSSRFDARHAASLTTGREWYWTSKKNKPREFGIHIRSMYRGGLREIPIDEARSQQFLFAQYHSEQGYSQQLPAYFRIDLRLSLRTHRASSTRLWYLDIQNATAHRNVAYRYFDSLQNKVLTRYQLGIIPVLGYRVEF